MKLAQQKGSLARRKFKAVHPYNVLFFRSIPRLDC